MLIERFLPHSFVTAHLAQPLLGLMASTTSTIQHSRLKMRSLQSWYLSLFDPMTDPSSKFLQVTLELSSQLFWWDTPSNLFIGRPFTPLQLSVQITTDASPTGWGADYNSLHIHAPWSCTERALHINNIELLAIFKAFRAFF